MGCVPEAVRAELTTPDWRQLGGTHATLGHQSGVTLHPRNSALKSASGTPLPQAPSPGVPQPLRRSGAWTSHPRCACPAPTLDQAGREHRALCCADEFGGGSFPRWTAFLRCSQPFGSPCHPEGPQHCLRGPSLCTAEVRSSWWTQSLNSRGREGEKKERMRERHTHKNLC